jgi:hypothetical protein
LLLSPPALPNPGHLPLAAFTSSSYPTLITSPVLLSPPTLTPPGHLLFPSQITCFLLLSPPSLPHPGHLPLAAFPSFPSPPWSPASCCFHLLPFPTLVTCLLMIPLYFCLYMGLSSKCKSPDICGGDRILW